MAEIEVKARVQEFDSLLKKLSELGCEVTLPISQKDVVFTDGETDPKKRNIIRIRDTKGKHILTLKRDREDELDCIEIETEVGDPEAMRDMLHMMGYEERVRVNKLRRKAAYRDYEICLDEVEGLGSFIEVEKISEESGEAIKNEILEFLISLGVSPNDRVFHGYDTLLEQKNRTE
jgi:adenylate cyclase, class 2